MGANHYSPNYEYENRYRIIKRKSWPRIIFFDWISFSEKEKREKGKIFSLLGDGECYEGSVWESAISATELNLDNLTAVIDLNGFQNDGKMGSKMSYKAFITSEGFGWNTILCDGHDILRY